MRRWIGILILGLAFILCPSAKAQGAAHFDTVSWTASASSGVIGYNVYMSTTSGGPYTKLTTTALASTVTTYQYNGAVAGTTRYFVVTALNGTTESVFSTQVSVVDAGTTVLPPTAVTVVSQ
jgi:hypothetical protein